MKQSVIGKLVKTFAYSQSTVVCKPCNKLFISGLCFDTNEKILKEAFKKFGEVLEARVVCDHVSSKSKGYGFVQFAHESEASIALNKMNAQLLDGWKLRISYAKNGLNTQGSECS